MRLIASLLVVFAAMPRPAAVAQVEVPSNDVVREAVVDEPPERRSCPAMEYPELLRQASIEGSARVLFVVEANGSVLPENVVILEATHRLFEEPVREMIVRCSFRPGRMRDAPVRVLVEMPIEFRLEHPTELPAAARDTLALRILLPDATDVSPSARMAWDGPEENSLGGFGAPPIAGWARKFHGPPLTFHVGSAELVELDLLVNSFPTSGEAQQSVDFLEFFDLGQLMAMILGVHGDSAVHVVGRDSVAMLGDRRGGWMIEIRAGVTNTDVYVALLARGRVAAMLVAAASPGALVPQELHRVVQFIDERILGDPHLLEDVADQSVVVDADTAYVPDPTLLERTGGVDLTQILLRASDLNGARVTGDAMVEEGVVGWERTFEGRAGLIPVGGSHLISVNVEVDQFESVEDALRQIAQIQAAASDPEAALAEFMGGADSEGGLPEGIEVSMGRLDVPTIGFASEGIVVHFTGMMELDMAAVAYVQGRISVDVMVMAPKDQARADDLAELVRRTYERLRAVVPDEVGHGEGVDVLPRLRRAASLGFAASRLARGHDPLAAWDTVTAMRAIDPGAEFGGESLNLICWYGSLDGHAERVLPACDEAVAEDSTSASWRDSRGLARALTGDTAGAIEDFQYYVDWSFSDDAVQREGWIEQLRAGKNPFTAKVLESLKKP